MSALEDTSYWFAHRNSIIESVARHWPWEGPLLDVGGGNGFQARLLSKIRAGVVLVEPGAAGCRHAISRGINPVVRATLESLRLRDGSIGAVALFDVIEHLAARKCLLCEAARILRKGGRLYVTVPSLPWLWSDEDIRAEHKLRYNAATLRAELAGSGFRVEHLSYFFLPLVGPIFAFRTLPMALGFRRKPPRRAGREHSAAGLVGGAMSSMLEVEARWIAGGRRLPFGSSLICVASKP